MELDCIPGSSTTVHVPVTFLILEFALISLLQTGGGPDERNHFTSVQLSVVPYDDRTVFELKELEWRRQSSNGSDSLLRVRSIQTYFPPSRQKQLSNHIARYRGIQPFTSFR